MSSNDAICVIAANNSKTADDKNIDYIQLASIAADRVKYYLDLPTYIISADLDEASKYSNFAGILTSTPTKITKRNVMAGNDHIQYDWLNDTRISAFELTKGLADRVLMIDADYMVASAQLRIWVNSDNPFSIFTSVKDLSNRGIYSSKYLPSNDIIQRWATAMCWDHSEEAEAIFETAKMVRDNYDFYAVMFGMPKSLFRNDVAFSVACHLFNVPAYENQQLWNLVPAANIKYSEKMKEWLLLFNDTCVIWNHDVHVLNKQYAIDPALMDQLRLNNVPA